MGSSHLMHGEDRPARANPADALRRAGEAQFPEGTGTGYSVIIPVYNRATKLVRAVGSVREAARWTTAPVEIIVIDDASTDDSAAVARRLQVDRVESLPRNQGVTGAKNRGVDHAAKEWLVFLDSDDLLAPDAFAKIEALETAAPAIDILFGACATLAGTRLVGNSYMQEFWTYEKLLCEGSPGEFLPVCRRRVFADLRYVTELRGFEGVTWLNAARQGFRIYYTAQILRIYDDTGSDRLCAKHNLVKDSRRLAMGFGHIVKEFGADMAKLSISTYMSAVFRCYFYRRCAGMPPQDIAGWPQYGVILAFLEIIIATVLRLTPVSILHRLWRR